jgi:plasmid stabilization system protein ParE
MKIQFLTLASRKVDDAVLWYEQQAEGLSRDFLDELDRAVRLVNSYPLPPTEIEPEVRRILFARFPYSLIYAIDQESIS